jgi:transposase
MQGVDLLHSEASAHFGLSIWPVIWTRGDIADLIEAQFGHRYHVSSLSKILRKLGFSRQKTRSSHPNADPKARL